MLTRTDCIVLLKSKELKKYLTTVFNFKAQTWAELGPDSGELSLQCSSQVRLH